MAVTLLFFIELNVSCAQSGFKKACFGNLGNFLMKFIS